jgi:alkaline phosphatase
MDYEYDRPYDLAGEPSLSEMTGKAIDLLKGKRRDKNGYFLMVESGRIDHAHHATNAYRAMVETEEFDKAIATALRKVDLRDTLIVVTADHSHVFSMAGYPMRPLHDLPYSPTSAPPDYVANNVNYSGILNVVYDISSSTGAISEAGDKDGIPYTILGYWNGGNPYDTGAPNTWRDKAAGRIDPRLDTHAGVSGSQDPNYIQEVAVQSGSETHSAEEVAIYAAGPQSWRFQGTVRNSKIAEVMRRALRMGNPN